MNVLVFIDCSSYADQILRTVSKRIWPEETKIRLVSILDSCGSVEVDELHMKKCEVLLENRLNQLRDKLSNLTIEGEVIVGDPSEQIVQEARERKTDLIVIGSHGDTGPRKEEGRSIAASVVDRAPCSIEIVKIHKEA